VIAPAAAPAVIAPVATPSVIAPVATPSVIAPAAAPSVIAPVAALSVIAPAAAPSVIAPAAPPPAVIAPAPSSAAVVSPPAKATPTDGASAVARSPGTVRGAPAPTGDAALKARIERLAATLDTLSLFELLNVPENAKPEEVTAAHIRALRQFHPDRLMGAGLASLAKQAEKIMSRMSEAASILADPKKRKEYEDARAGKPVEVDPAVLVLQAEQTFKKGEELLKKGEHAKAVEAFAEAKDKTPDEPEYLAYWTWARFETPGAAKGTIARDCLTALEGVLKTKPTFALAKFWSGQIWKFLGDMSKAEHFFRETLALDPKMVDAEREVRLIVMRRGKSASGASAPSTASARSGKGLLGKLFKG
jgi:curved DNA-binding protein CbpA